MFEKPQIVLLEVALFLCLCFRSAFATPTTLIWTPSTDIQPYGKIHLNIDNYTPVKSRDHNDDQLYVQQVYGPTFSLFSDKPEGNGLASDSQSHKPENNLLGKLWSPLGKIMAETGFDYKKGFGPILDKWPVYFHFKFGIPEGALSRFTCPIGSIKSMPAFAIGAYDMGYKRNFTNNNVWYVRASKTFDIGKFNLGRFSAGYFNGNGRLLRDKNGDRDNTGPMLAWERTLCEISDKLWVCVDYQGTQSSYGALNYGFAWKFTNNVSAIIGYDIYNNPNSKSTVTFQLDIDF